MLCIVNKWSGKLDLDLKSWWELKEKTQQTRQFILRGMRLYGSVNSQTDLKTLCCNRVLENRL